MEDLLKRLKRIRKANGMTQTDLAVKMGWPNAKVVTAIETGHRQLRLSEFLQWCEVCGTNAPDVLTGAPIQVDIAG